MDPESFTNGAEKDLKRSKGPRYKERRFIRPNAVEEV